MKGPIRKKKDQVKSEKLESCRDNLWNDIQFDRAIKTETDTRTE